MNVKQFLGSLFSNRNQSLNGQVAQARETGEHHAEIVVGAYLDGFEDRAAKMLLERSQRLLGFSPEPSEDIEGEVIEDLSGFSRPELMRLAKEKGIEYDRSATKDDLIQLLS